MKLRIRIPVETIICFYNKKTNKIKLKLIEIVLIIWFNSAYSTNVQSDVAATFLKLINKHFHKFSSLRMFFNRNSIEYILNSKIPTYAWVSTTNGVI